MSSEYYFIKWRDTLTRTEELVHLDQEFQKTKVHDKKRCDAVIRLCGILGEYIVLYNDAMECWHQNLQLQKAPYMFELVRAVTNRILELKHDIRKLEFSDTQFLGHGLAHHKLTTFDAEMDDVPVHIKRLPHIDAAVKEAFRKAKEKKEALRQAEEEHQEMHEEVNVDKWWDEDDADVINDEVKEENEPETEEMIQTRQCVSQIQAHERARQVIQMITQQKQRRQKWEMELNGTLKPTARIELRERGAKIIQKVMRAYFAIKRSKLHEFKIDEVLGIRLCGKLNKQAIYSANEVSKSRFNLRKEFEHQWKESRIKLKKDFEKRKKEDIADDYRSLINAWFRQWFDEIKYFQELPSENEGGSNLIMKEETPEPMEWWDSYQAYLEHKKAKKGKTSHELKYEREEAKREELMKKKEEQLRIQQEQKMMQKLMKNPTMHPGFHYPASKRTEQILEAINNYRKNWAQLDHTEIIEVKKKFVPQVDMDEIYAEVKMDLMQTVDNDMRDELKVLKKALKIDYENNEEKFPEPMRQPRKRAERKPKVKGKMSENIADKLEDLAYKEILIEYPQKTLGDFLGDHNFAGDDMRCNYEPAPHFAGETRAFWWERCREATHGFHKILVVGPPLSGKTVLVHALATVTDSVLFELDVQNLKKHSATSADLQRLVNSVVICAKAVQSSVIWIKHIHRLYYKKVPPEAAKLNLDVLRRSVEKILKKIDKSDRIAVVGWNLRGSVADEGSNATTVSRVVLVPDTSYSAVFRLLSYWVNENYSLPRNLDIHSLAFALRGYSYGHLERTLKEFLSAEQIVRIAARGLNAMEIYDYFLQKNTDKIDFTKYQKWYTEKTQWGKKEAKHIQEQREFKQLTEKYLEKADKKKKMGSGPSSTTSLKSGETSELTTD